MVRKHACSADVANDLTNSGKIFTNYSENSAYQNRFIFAPVIKFRYIGGLAQL